MKKNDRGKDLNNLTVPIHTDKAEPGFIPFYEFAEGLDAMSKQPKADKRDEMR
ncbi:hypothetical protein SPSYN_01095 [Sporotomaculum syntrophicum]|uniref:Uncharacterized protein n=1 Tax=Sporotomaculum syntrophicum TaxID=182264 RepID=A0A9D3AYM5_9FIRM|nr:hypothetical protein [Sporotomaculum syntrophicum]KAF1084959.1 hypothetical protein SPSYN_01095 [Sporotomaculum syntrophicum]